ncbi:hypothetical protein [Rhizobium phage RHEph12]|nr:hypothetical protein [Rhizobium phage RHEph12]
MTFINNLFLETSDVVNSLPALALEEGKSAVAEYRVKNHVSREIAEDIYKTMVNAPSWIKAAAPVYHISQNASDYFTVPTIIMPSDLPNRNLTAFPREELAKFDPEIGQQVYRGWIGKPVYIDHANRDYTKAIGVVADVSMRKIEGAHGDLWKVVALMAIDRTKNPVIANDILTGRRRNYSMGALVSAYECSICKQIGRMRAGLKDKWEALPCGKEHAYYDRTGGFRAAPITVPRETQPARTLGFLNARGVRPFEISTVGYPAFASAYTSENQINAL